MHQNSQATNYRSGFFQKGSKSLSKFTSENLKNNGLRTGALLGFISDIHRVRTNPANSLDVGIEPRQGTCLQAICSSNFLMLIWGVILFHSSKKSPVKMIIQTLSSYEHVQLWRNLQTYPWMNEMEVN